MGVVHDAHEQWEGLRVVSAACEEDVITRVSREQVSLLVLGPLLRASESCRVMRRCSLECSDRCPRFIVSGVGLQTTLFQDAIDDDSVYYMSRGALGGRELLALVNAAVRPMPAPEQEPYPRADDAPPDVLLDLLSRLSLQTDLSQVAALVADSVARLLRATDSQCLLYDVLTHTLWEQDERGVHQRFDSAAGLVGYVARTGHPVILERPEDDARYDREVDNPTGHPVTHFVAQPMHGMEGTVIGVVTAARADDAAFTADELRVLSRVVACGAPTLAALLLQRSLRQRVSDMVASDSGDIYRREALEHHARGSFMEGHLIAPSPGWLRLTPTFLVATVAILFVGLVLVRIPEYASGSGVIRPRTEIAVTAPAAGRLDAMEVRGGQHVEPGALLGRLVRLSDGGEEPLWAPARGVVTSLDVRIGQLVGSGERLAHIVDESAGYEFVAFLPASYESQIATGMSMFFRIHDYADLPQVARIDAVGPVLLSRSEAARIGGDFVPIPGPVVVVRSRLPQTAPSAFGKSVRYRHGMTGDADVKLGAAPAITSLIPPLRQLMGPR